MAISDKILTLNNAKQNIKQAIESKGVSTVDTPFTDYHLKIAEISGGAEQLPQLNPLTISRTDDTLTIDNPTTNGNFLEKIKIVDKGLNVLAEKATSENTTFDLSTLGLGDYNISARASNSKFKDSLDSNQLPYGIYNITSDLTDLTTSSEVEEVAYDRSYTTTLTAGSGKYLPTNINITMGGEVVSAYNNDYSYNNDTGELIIPDIQGNIIITAAASDYVRLESPVISLEYDLVSWNIVDYAEEYSIVLNGIETSTVYGLNFNILDLELEDGEWEITVIAKGLGYQNSNLSNLVKYRVGVKVFGVTGLHLPDNPLTRTDDAVDMSYYINESTGIITTDFDEYFPEQYVGDNLEPVFFNLNTEQWENELNEIYEGNVFRKIDKFYKQVNVLPETENDQVIREGFKISIGNLRLPSYYCPAYFINENGQEMDYILIGVYRTKIWETSENSYLRSIPFRIQDHQSWNNSWTNFLEAGKNSATDFLNKFHMDWRVRQLLLDLYMIIFGTRHLSIYDFTGPSTGLGSSSNYTSGYTDALKGISQFGNLGNFNLFLGIEDFLSPGYAATGIFRNNSSPYFNTIVYSMTPSTDTPGANLDLGTKLVGYRVVTLSSTPLARTIKVMGYDKNCPDLEYPVILLSTGGNTTYYGVNLSINSGATSRTHWMLYGFSYVRTNSGGITSTSDVLYGRLCAQPWGQR